MPSYPSFINPGLSERDKAYAIRQRLSECSVPGELPPAYYIDSNNLIVIIDEQQHRERKCQYDQNTSRNNYSSGSNENPRDGFEFCMALIVLLVTGLAKLTVMTYKGIWGLNTPL